MNEWMNAPLVFISFAINQVCPGAYISKLLVQLTSTMKAIVVVVGGGDGGGGVVTY